MNAWSVGLAAGLLEGRAYSRCNRNCPRVDDGDKMHVLPIVRRGPTQNVNSLLYLHGIDTAIINLACWRNSGVGYPISSYGWLAC